MMKLKQFMLALVAMMLGFALPTSAQVAKVGNTEYATIDEAIANWGANTTLTLLSDVTLSDVVKINSNESRTLDLGTYTMTAASGKDAFQYVVKGCTSDVGLSIKADATNPGGINAPGKAIIVHEKPKSNAPAKDRPYTQFFGGVFNATNIVKQYGWKTVLFWDREDVGYSGASAPRFVFHGGEFNGTIYTNRSKITFNGGTFNGNIQISVDTSSDALVKGGKFKNLFNSFGSTLNSDKFTIGSAEGTYDRGIYVDKDGYYVVTSEVITEVSAKYPAVKKESYNSNNYFYYSAAATYGMFYEVASMAGTGSNVTVWEKPAVTIPEDVTGDANVVEEIKNNTALKDYTPVNLPEGAELEIELKSVGETIVYDVTPMANGAEVEPTEAITFRLPVPASVTETLAKVYHDGVLMGVFAIQGESNAKFVEVSSADFSEFAVEPVTVYEVDTYEKLVAALANDGAIVKMTADITATATQSTGYGKAGVVVDAGDVLDGNGKKLTINGAGATWDCAIAMSGGEVKNLTISGAMRGIFMPGANGDVVVDNCVFEGVIYTFNSDAGSKDYKVNIKNTTLNGWTSFSNVHKSVTFESCTFGEGSGYAFCRPYQEGTTFIDCAFAAGYEFDTKQVADNTLVFNDCTYNDEALSADNNAMFYNGGSVVIDGEETNVTSVAKVGDKGYTSLEAAAAAAKAGDVITLKADVTLAESLTLPAGITFNGDNFTIAGTIVAAGDITFAGVTKASDLDFGAYNTVVNIPADASLQLNGSARMSIGFGTTFNITGTISDAKTADKATLVPSLVIPGASFTGSAGVKFNVTNAYISVPSSYCSTSKTASGTFDFNITNSIWESAGKLAFEEQSVNAKVDFALVNSVLTTGSHLVFGTASGEEGVVIDNSLVNEGTSRQLENCGTMTIKNGSVVNGAVATSANAKNPGTIIVENATYAVTGEFSGSDLGIGTLIIKKGATVSAGSITKANITIDATDMAAGELANFTANLSKFAGELSVINNDKLEAKIVDGKIVLAAKPVAKIGETLYATVQAAINAAKEGDVVEIFAGEYGAIDISNKNITIQGAVGADGELLTTIKGGNPAITAHSFNGTIKDIKIVDAFKVMYAEPARNVTVDNIYVTGATYGLHLVAYSTGLTWTIQNSYMDLSWANSFGVYDSGDAAIVITGNKFESTDPYYPDYGALAVNTFLPNVTVKENIFGNNAKIKIADSVTDLSDVTISKNYHADGFENAFVEDSQKADIDSYYKAVAEDGTLQDLVNVVNSLEGEGTEASPYLIRSVDELVFFRDHVNAGKTKYNAEGVYVALGADIDLAGIENWEPIGTFDYSFDSNFDGKGYAIQNLMMTDNTAANGYAYLGFFGVTANNVVKNFVIENVTIKSEGQIVAAAIAYPYYTTVSDITVKGDIAIKGGNYTAGVLAYTRLCQNASNLAVVGNEGSYITGAQVVGGVIADIQMNKDLVANYSNFSAEGVTVSGTKNVGGISGIIATQTLNGASVKNVTLKSDDAHAGIVSGALGGTSTISGVTYENVTGATALLGATYEGNAIEAKINDTYFATVKNAMASNVDGVVEIFTDVTINDADGYTYTKDAMVNGTLTYKRALVEGYWNTLFVPFEIPMSMLSDYDVAYINDMHSYDKDYNGVIEEFGLEVIHIKDETATLNASHPYVIRPKNAEAATMELVLRDDAILFSSSEQTDVTCSSAYMNFTFKGSYSKIAVSETDRYYILTVDENGEQTFGYAAAGSTLKPFRFYFTMESRGGSYVKVDDTAFKSVRIYVQGEGDTTGIVGTEFNTNGEDLIFDLQGRRVLEPKKGGIYIINGKKVYYNK